MTKCGIKLGLFVVLIAFFAGCGGSSSGGGGGDGGGTSFDLFTSAEDAGPVVTPTAVGGSISGDIVNPMITPKDAIWSSHYNLYEIFYLIREYVNSRDSGVIDGSNMYKAMYSAQEYVDETFETCAASDEHDITDQAITSPFDFGDDLFSQTYDCAFTTTETIGSVTYVKSLASKHIDETYYALIGSHTIEESQSTSGVWQTQYDSESNTIKVNSAYLVDYDNDEKYSIRIYINGNTETGLFSLKLFKYDLSDQGAVTFSIAGYGYSKGTAYYLFRLTSAGETLPMPVTDRFFCFESETTQAEMGMMSDAGLASIPEACAILEEGLPSNLDVSEVPTATDAFTGGGDYGIELSWN